jgi:hypothetical protein
MNAPKLCSLPKSQKLTNPYEFGKVSSSARGTKKSLIVLALCGLFISIVLTTLCVIRFGFDSILQGPEFIFWAPISTLLFSSIASRNWVLLQWAVVFLIGLTSIAFLSLVLWQSNPSTILYYPVPTSLSGALAILFESEYIWLLLSFTYWIIAMIVAVSNFCIELQNRSLIH